MPGDNRTQPPADSSSVAVTTGSETPSAPLAPQAHVPEVPASKPVVATTPDAPPASSSPSTPADGDKPPANGKEAAKPDAVQEAIAQLTGKPVKPAAPPAKAPISKPPPGPVRDPQGKFAPLVNKAPETKAPKVEAAPQTKQGLEHDPLEGFADEEKSSFKTKTRERITDLHQRWRAAENKAAELEKDPAVGLGRSWAQAIEEENLHDDVPYVPAKHLGGLVRVQAAINRAELAAKQNRDPSEEDAETLASFVEQTQAIAKKFGLAPASAPAAAPAIAPVQGVLPEAYQDLIDTFGLPEADVRLLAAIKAKGQPPGTQQAVSQPPPPPVQAPQPRQRGVDLEQLYTQRLVTTLVTEHQVPAERATAHLRSLMPIAAEITRKLFPTATEADVGHVFNALPPKEKFEILLQAQHQAASRVPPRVPVQPPNNHPPATQHVPQTGRAPGEEPAPPLDAVAAAKYRLIGR